MQECSLLNYLYIISFQANSEAIVTHEWNPAISA